jgi:hypothetical protein
MASPPFAVVQVESAQHKNRPDQQLDQGAGILEGPVGSGGLDLFGMEGSTLDLPPRAPLGLLPCVGLGGRPGAEVELVRPAVDPDAPVEVQPAALPALPAHPV